MLLFRGLRIRVGVHLGNVVREAGRVRGPAVYHVARITGVAHGGQNVVSEAAWLRLRGGLPGAVVLRDLGAHRITGVDGARRLLQVLPAELDRRAFPEPASQGVRHSNLTPEEDFVGRQQDIAALVELAGLGVRLITVLGEEGTGTSRLCRQLAQVRRAEADLIGGVWLAIAPVSTVAGVVGCLAEALSVGLADAAVEEEAVRRIGHALATRGRTLVVLDGLTRPDPGVGRAVETWMRLAPATIFVVASDVRLRIRGEVAYALGPLGMPDAGVSARHADAVRMYASRARAISATFSVGSGDEIARLIASVGAYPRAIRLLAGAVDRVPVSVQREALAGIEPPTPVPRALGISTDMASVTLASVQEIAWGALTPEERSVLAVCAMHQGSFEAIELPPGLPGAGEQQVLLEAGAGDGGAEDEGAEELEITPPRDIHQILESLDRRGWLRVAPDPSASGVLRYAVAPDVRRFVRRRYPPEGIVKIVRERDALLIREFRGWSAAVIRSDDPEVVARISVEWPNLVQLVEGGLDKDKGSHELATAVGGLLMLRPVLLSRGPLFVGFALADAVLQRCDEVLDADPGLQIQALALRAELSLRGSRPSAALQDLDRAEAIAERWGDEGERALTTGLRGRALWALGDPDGAWVALESAVQLYTRADDPLGASSASAWLGAVEMTMGRYAEAEARLHTAAEVLRGLGAATEEARALGWLALSLRRTGRAVGARSLYLEVIRLLVQEGDTRAESYARSDLAILDYHLGRLAEADAGLEEASAVGRRIGDRAAEAHATGHGGLVALARGRPRVARERLLSALAVHRDLGDTGAEGHITGVLGVLHHVSDQPEGARECYKKSLRLLEAANNRRLTALFFGWYAALEAEDGRADAAESLYGAALASHAESGDPQIGEALAQLKGAVDWVAAGRADKRGGSAEATALREAALARMQASLDRREPLPGEARLALARVERLVRGRISRL
ncbi:MAG TPA: hypothetical protein ENK18_02970 [Deltaproteobacteria bacterium]|nr:hypothetical protein [Deltaproteobacteria bacterium]